VFSLNDIMAYGTLVDGALHITDSFCMEIPRENVDGCMIISATAAYTGPETPQIQFSLKANGYEKPVYLSHVYRVGRKNDFARQQWRVPPMFLSTMKTVISVTVPTGTTLVLLDFSGSNSHHIPQWNGGLRHNAHLGFYGIAPNNTMPAFELAAECGFPACIVVPQVTADGKLVCIHDDTINRTARNKDGNPPTEPIYVKDKTYEELLEWEYGSYYHEIWRGTKIPLLEDFFLLCARTGMRPMFSTHHPGLTVPQWQQVKDMLVKLGLLKNFHIKSFRLVILQTAYSVFGTEIEGYTWDNGDVAQMSKSGIDASRCRVGIEWKAAAYTQENVRKILDAGFFAAAWSIGRVNSVKYEELISYGVTEFTEDYHCSMGLNWW
jgi:glycerophosphoryl diester phosphodiesterase